MFLRRVLRLIKRTLQLFLRREQDRFENGRLHLPQVYLAQSGTTHRAVLRVVQESPTFVFELEQIVPSPFPAPIRGNLSFVCNVCGNENIDAPLDVVSNREAASCTKCHSSLRMRSVMNALSVELFGKSIPAASFPVSRNIRGIGLSDWNGYARLLRDKFSYVNTFYHQEPRLDITKIREEDVGKYDFVISSDVMEHVPYKDLGLAFVNMRRLLKPDGFLLLTVPYKPDGDTDEYYPELNDFRFITTRDKTFLYNRTADGTEQIFDNLVFHGGGGFTLEMRMYSESGLLKLLADSGFSGGARIYRDDDERFGIVWPIRWAVPLVARKAGTDAVAAG